MRKIFFIIFFSVLYNCQNDVQNERLRSHLNFEPELIQQFEVAPDSIINIQGEKGTKISFKTQDLQGLLSGPIIEDSLQINLVELTTKQDLLLANAQTVSDNKWLISGGAFKIEILCHGETLKLKDGKTISITFPKKTSETGMQLFFGERDKKDFMNWKTSEVTLEEQKYYSLFYTTSSQLDSVSTVLYGIDIISDEPLIIDTLGYLSLSEYKSIYPKVDSVYVVNDTLSNLKSWKNYEDFLSNITNSQIANNTFYNSVTSSKLGWINIDMFAPEESKVNITLNYSKNIDVVQNYLVDEKNNTILNSQSSKSLYSSK